MSPVFLVWLGSASILTLYIAMCLAKGAVPMWRTWIRRQEKPGWYWLGIAIPVFALFVITASSAAVWSLGRDG